MSTKLYEGLRLKDPAVSLFDAVARVAAAINAEFNSQAEKVAAEKAALICDSPSLRQERAGQLLFTAAQDEWLHSQHRLNEHSALHDPLRFSIVLGQAASGRVLAYPFFSEPAYRQALEATALFEDYHYQDQADQPDEIEDREWELRQTDWDSVLDENGAFASLPMWQLADSIRGVFSLDRASLDANEHVTPEARLRRALSARDRRAAGGARLRRRNGALHQTRREGPRRQRPSRPCIMACAYPCVGHARGGLARPIRARRCRRRGGRRPCAADPGARLNLAARTNPTSERNAPPMPIAADTRFLENPAIRTLADSPRWTVSGQVDPDHPERRKAPIDIRELKSSGRIRGAYEKTANCLMGLDELCGFLPNAANLAFALNTAEDALMVLDIEKTCPGKVSQELLADLLPHAAYSELSMSGKGYHLVMPLPGCFQDYPAAAEKTRLREEHGWYEILLMHWVTFTGNPIPAGSQPQAGTAAGKAQLSPHSGHHAAAAWGRLYASLAGQARHSTAAGIAVDAEKPEIPGEADALYLLTAQALPKTLDDFDGDNSRFEFSCLGTMLHRLKPLLPYLASEHGIEYTPSMRAWLAYQAVARMIPHRAKHDELRNGMPLLLDRAAWLTARHDVESDGASERTE